MEHGHLSQEAFVAKEGKHAALRAPQKLRNSDCLALYVGQAIWARGQQDLRASSKMAKLVNMRGLQVTR